MRPIARESGTIGVEQNRPIFTPGRGEARRLGGDGEVAGGDELAAGGGGDAVHLRDHRLRDAVDRLHQHGADVEEPLVEVGVATDHLAQVVAGARTPARRPRSRSPARSGSDADLLEHAISSCISASESAFRFSGRLSVIRAARRLDADEHVLAVAVAIVLRRYSLRGADARLAPGPLPLAQHELLHLAGRRLRQRAELDGVRALVVREAVAGEAR